MKVSKRILSVIILGFLVFLIGCATLEKGGGERVRLKEPRIKALAESEWNAEQQKLLTPLKMPQLGGRVLNVITTIANNPKLTESFLPGMLYIAGKSTLPPREREILMLRIGWHCRALYEFGWHTVVGKSVGLKDEEIKRITEGPKAAGWNAFDATLLRAVDELYYDAFITDVTWNTLAERYNQQQLIDVVATVGEYNLISMMLNTFGVQFEDPTKMPGFPEGKK
jgi:4-carboxymuconolactone decarboxylase